MSPRGAACLFAWVWALAASPSAAVEVSGELSQEFRLYPNPEVVGNTVETTVGGEATLRGNLGGSVRWLVSPRLWVDPADPDRFRWIPRDAWIAGRKGSTSLALGRRTVTWGGGDTYRPTDVAGTVDLGLDFTSREKRGDWMANLTVAREAWGLEVVWLPVLEGMRFPGPRSPWSINAATVRLGGSEGAVELKEDPILPADRSEQSIGARLRVTFGNTDLHLVGFHGLDRNPVLAVFDDCDGRPGCIPTQAVVRDAYAPLTLGGVEIASAIAGILMRVEATYRDQASSDSTFQAQTPAIAETSVQFVAGMDYVFQGVAGGESDLTLVAEYLYDDSRTVNNVLVFRPLQNDVSVALVWSANDWWGTTVEAVWVQDMERAESAGSLRVRRRITGELTAELGADILRAPTPTTLQEAANPFSVYSVNDRVRIKVSYFF